MKKGLRGGLVTHARTHKHAQKQGVCIEGVLNHVFERIPLLYIF